MTVQEYRDLVHEVTKDFEPKKAIKSIKNWLENYSNETGLQKVVLGISGGKDSTVVAKLCADVLGADNVNGIMLPNGTQKDINDSIRVTQILGIKSETINIMEAFDALCNSIPEISKLGAENVAPRIRMTVLYAYAASHGCRVAGTGNLSEKLLGYFTKWGDGAHDFNLIGNYTSLEVMRIGEELGLPIELVYKTPSDGLSGLSDEEKLGVTYADVHKFIRCDAKGLDSKTFDKIVKIAKSAEHKIKPIPSPADYKNEV